MTPFEDSSYGRDVVISNSILLVYFMFCIAALNTAPRAASAGQSSTCSARDLAAEMKPGSPLYIDANELAKALVARGFVVKCVLRSKMEGLFEGMSGAALYRTDRGDFEALFLPKPQSFEALEVVEGREDGRYIYSFRGDPRPRTANRIDSSRPMYFIKHANRLLIIWGHSQLAESVRQVLSPS
jgi:hypothetical protein